MHNTLLTSSEAGRCYHHFVFLVSDFDCKEKTEIMILVVLNLQNVSQK